MAKVSANMQDKQGAEQTAGKNKASHVSSRRSTLDFRKYTQQIWLAGLGAFSRAEEEGSKLFDSLVRMGEELEVKTTDIADHTVFKVTEKARESVTDTRDKVEKLIDYSVQHYLKRIGLVSLKDMQHLEDLVQQLHYKVDVLLEENKQLKQQIEQSQN